jgi:hypothetical protein
LLQRRICGARASRKARAHADRLDSSAPALDLARAAKRRKQWSKRGAPSESRRFRELERLVQTRSSASTS